MEKRSVYTIKTLLKELKEKTPNFEKNQIFETKKSIYPDSSIDKKNRVIKFNLKEFTKPLAVSRRDKAKMEKEDNKMLNFFRDITKGDFLKVIETDGEVAKCNNVSLKEAIKEKFYNDEETKFIKIGFKDIVNGNIKLVKRRIDKYLE